MCGIVYVRRNDKHSPVTPLLKRYEEQKSRGQRGFGFVAVSKEGKVMAYERDTTFEGIREKLERYEDAREILFHHRLPTSTENIEETAHPIHVSNQILKSDYYLVHNGVISNDDDLKEDHEKLGFKYNTEIEKVEIIRQKNGKKKTRESFVRSEYNDSETLAIEFALFNEGFKDNIEVRGSAAFIAYEVDKNTQDIIAIHYGRNSQNPLKIFRAHGLFSLSSESKDTNAHEIQPYKVYSIYYKDEKITQRDVKFLSFYSGSSSYYNGEYGGAEPRQLNLGYEHDDEHKTGFDVRTYASRHQLPDQHKRDCPHGGKDPKLCARCTEHNMHVKYPQSQVIEICGTTGVGKDRCWCKRHRKASKQLRKQLKLEEKNRKKSSILSPYTVDMDDSEYGVDTASQSASSSANGNDFYERIKNNINNLEKDIRVIESQIEECSLKMQFLEDLKTNDETTTTEWLNTYARRDDLKKALDGKQRACRSLTDQWGEIVF